jgi:hypothetical protein
VIIDAGHVRWAAATVLAAIGALIGYAWADRITPGGVRGGTTAGLWFGIIGTGMMAYAGLLSALRKVPSWSWLGARKTWLKGHIWFGLLSVVFILCHGGFRFGSGWELALWAVYAAIIVSGLFGLLVQQSLPSVLTRQSPGEVSYEQIPHYSRGLAVRAEDLVDAMQEARTGSDDAMNQFASDFDRIVRPYLGGSRPRDGRFISETAIATWYQRVRDALQVGAAPESPARALESAAALPVAAVRPDGLAARAPKLLGDLNRLTDTLQTAGLAHATRGFLADLRAATMEMPEVAPAVSRQLTAHWLTVIEELTLERHRLHAQERVHRWLHGWLLIHVPLSAALLVLTGVHIFMSLYY